jgi:hypothetical protein
MPPRGLGGHEFAGNGALVWADVTGDTARIRDQPRRGVMLDR